MNGVRVRPVSLENVNLSAEHPVNPHVDATAPGWTALRLAVDGLGKLLATWPSVSFSRAAR